MVPLIDSFTFYQIRNPYNRKFRLQKIGFKIEKAPYYYGLILYFLKNERLRRFLPKNFNFIDDSKNHVKSLNNILKEKKNFLFGYFQSFSIVETIKSELKKNIRLPEPKNPKIRRLGEICACSNSVAVGIRLYEETNDSSKYSSEAYNYPPEKYANQIDKIVQHKKNSLVLLFSASDNCFIQRIAITCEKKNIPFEFPEISDLETLWLLSMCRHHVFNNSTFYWWGAYLSQNRFHEKNRQQIIKITSNFLNPAVYPPEWQKF